MSGRVSWTCGADLACSPLRGLEIGPAQCSGDFLLPRSVFRCAHVICSVYTLLQTIETTHKFTLCNISSCVDNVAIRSQTDLQHMNRTSRRLIIWYTQAVNVFIGCHEDRLDLEYTLYTPPN